MFTNIQTTSFQMFLLKFHLFCTIASDLGQIWVNKTICLPLIIKIYRPLPLIKIFTVNYCYLPFMKKFIFNEIITGELNFLTVHGISLTCNKTKNLHLVVSGSCVCKLSLLIISHGSQDFNCCRAVPLDIMLRFNSSSSTTLSYQHYIVLLS